MLSRAFTEPVSKLVFVSLSICIATLLLLNLVANLLASHYGLYHEPWIGGLIRMVSVNDELNLPTWFSSCQLAGAGIVALTTAALTFKHGRPWGYHWLSVGLLFLLLSLDESVSLHEMATGPMRRLLGADGVFYFAWIVPGIAFVLLLSIVYLRFVLSLPPGVRIRVIVSAAIFLAGAVGMEMVGGYVREVVGTTEDVTYVCMFTLEEGLEMTGVMLFITAVLRYVELTFPLRTAQDHLEPASSSVLSPAPHHSSAPQPATSKRPLPGR